MGERVEGRGCHFLYSGTEKKTSADQSLSIKPRSVRNEKHNADPEMSVLFTSHKQNKRLSKIREEIMNHFRLN